MSPVAFKAVTVLGAAYLAWLGVSAIKGSGALALQVGGDETGVLKAGREAVLTNLLNPKVILLFLALLPNFVEAGRGDEGAQLLTLAAALIVINTLWQAPIALAADVVRRWLSSDAVCRRVSVASGLIFIGFAVGLLAQHLV